MKKKSNKPSDEAKRTSSGHEKNTHIKEFEKHSSPQSGESKKERKALGQENSIDDETTI